MKIFIPGTENIDVNSIEVKDLNLLPFIKGKSAYDIAVSNGFSGTEADWLNSLKVEFQATANEFLKQAISAEQTRKDNEVSRVEAENLRKQEFDRILETFAVVDNLESESITKALSANQGRILNGKITKQEPIYISYRVFDTFYNGKFYDDDEFISIVFGVSGKTHSDMNYLLNKIYVDKASVFLWEDRQYTGAIPLIAEVVNNSSYEYGTESLNLCYVDYARHIHRVSILFPTKDAEDKKFQFINEGAILLEPCNDLTSDDVNVPLSANQGRILNEKINNLNLYYWDGKSSDENLDNIQLWQKIVDTAKTATVLVAFHAGERSEYANRGVLIITSEHISEGACTFYASVTSFGDSKDTSGYRIVLKQPSVNITINNNVVTRVGSIVYSSINNMDSNYLPTNNTNVTSYTPTYDYHPATKKYVDENIEILNGKFTDIENSIGEFSSTLDIINGEVI